VGDVERVQQCPEAVAVLGEIDRVRRSPPDRHPGLLERAGQLERRLAAELDDDPVRLLELDHVEHVLVGHRLEVELVGHVVVGAHGLRVAVDHDGFDPQGPQCHNSVHTAVVELDSLADAVGPPAQDHHLLARGGDGLVLRVVGGVEVGGEGFELRGTGVDDLVGGYHPGRFPDAADLPLALAGEQPQVLVGEAHALGLAQGFGPQGVAFGILARDDGLELHQLAQVFQEPDVDAGDG